MAPPGAMGGLPLTKTSLEGAGDPLSHSVVINQALQADSPGRGPWSGPRGSPETRSILRRSQGYTAQGPCLQGLSHHTVTDPVPWRGGGRAAEGWAGSR